MCNYSQSEGLVFLIMSFLMIPNIVVQLVLIIMKKNTPTFFSFVGSLILNCAFGCLLCYFYDPKIYDYVFYILFFLGYIIFLPLNFINFFNNELNLKYLGFSEFQNVIFSNKAAFPFIKLISKAYHLDIKLDEKLKIDKNGFLQNNGNIQYCKTETFSDIKEFQYQSWEDKGNYIKEYKNSIISCSFDVKFILDDDLKYQLLGMEKLMNEEALKQDEFADTKVLISVPDFQKYVNGFYKEDVTKVFIFYQSIGRLLWFVFTLIGYECVFESIWYYHRIYIRIPCIKLISGRKDIYRCHYKEKDRIGGETSIGVYDPFRYCIFYDNEMNTLHISSQEV